MDLFRLTKANMTKLDTASATGKEGMWPREEQTELSKFSAYRIEMIMSEVIYLFETNTTSNKLVISLLILIFGFT